MFPVDSCFVDEVIEPIQLIDIGPNLHQQSHFVTLDDLTTYLTSPQTSEYTCRYMSVLQPTPQPMTYFSCG